MAGLVKRLKANESITIKGTTWTIRNESPYSCTIRVSQDTLDNIIKPNDTKTVAKEVTNGK